MFPGFILGWIGQCRDKDPSLLQELPRPLPGIAVDQIDRSPYLGKLYALRLR